MAKSNAQPDSEVDWNFSDDEAETVEKVATDVAFKSPNFIDRDDLAQELYLWLALRKRQRDKCAKGHAATLYRNVNRRALDYVKSESKHYEREVPTDVDQVWPG